MSETKQNGTGQASDHRNSQQMGYPVQRAVQPPVDIVEDASGITLWMDLPGVSPEKLDLQVHDANLFIKAEADVVAAEDLRLHHAELQVPRFSRTFALSTDFDTEKIQANLKDGVLKLSIPRHEKARPRRIEVQAG
jgi:HSP20 family molecular chaperone IbpA